jgi:hypothetical protein
VACGALLAFRFRHASVNIPLYFWSPYLSM